MRFERIELDGFGHFHQASWTLSDGLTVIRGDNEAGKTTFLNAVRALLFGFEATREGRTWYPAIAGGRRGGRLVLRTAAGERWVVERHGERGGGGTLVVRAPNGSQGGQETLDRLLRGADKDLFNNIFAFGLGELQHFHSLSTEGVRGRIYGASAGLGGSSAVDLEQELRGQLRESFVPSGSKPPLNDLLARIEQLRGEISDLSHQPAEHAAAHRERAELIESSGRLRERIRELREHVAKLGRVEAAGPIAAELALVEADLAAGDPSLDEVPPDAVAVLDRLSGEVGELRARLDAIDEQLADARAKRGRIEIDDRLLARADEVAAVVQERAARGGAEGRRSDLESGHARSAAAVEEQLARVGGWDEARLLAVDDSIPAVEATRAHERAVETATKLAREAEAGHRAAADELERREREGGPDQTLDDAVIQARGDALRGLEVLRVRRATAEALGVSGPPSPRFDVPVLVTLAVALVAGGGLIGTMAGMLVPGLLAGAAVAAVAALLLASAERRTAAGAEPVDLAELGAERARLLAALNLAPDATDDDVRASADELATERARRAMSDEWRSTLAARRADVERRSTEARAADEAARTAQAAWATWLEGRGLAPGTSPDAARQVMTAAGIARRASAERDRQAADLAELEHADAAFAARADALLSELGIPTTDDPSRRHAVVVNLGTRLEEARDAHRRAKELDATIEQLTARREPVSAAVAQHEDAVAAHLGALGCIDADALRRRVARAAARSELRGRARELRERLAGIAGSLEALPSLVEESAGADPAALEAARAGAADELSRVELDEREALTRIGALEDRIRQLEAAEELGMRRQELAVLEGRASAMAREWAVKALTLRLLEETRARYERERQPDVVRAAESHFERITGGRYGRIITAPGEATVRIESEGGEAKGTDELSRGTAEQLYLALRFGLIEEFARHAEPLPVVMDDILVNFDPDRADRAADALRALAERHQVLFFTCHPRTAQLLDPGGDRTISLDATASIEPVHA
ncbi:MAG TPA: AAA family ATPase [Candidatus Limnocylindria bacterium]|nr:AAA family ATPase [Candidatus Limnocylindria bacterium]